MRERKIINVNTLQLFNSLTECAKFYGCSIENIHFKCRRRDWAELRYKTVKNSFDLAYYDEWIDYPDYEKKKLCVFNNVDFFSMVSY